MPLYMLVTCSKPVETIASENEDLSFSSRMILRTFATVVRILTGLDGAFTACVPRQVRIDRFCEGSKMRIDRFREGSTPRARLSRLVRQSRACQIIAVTVS